MPCTLPCQTVNLTGLGNTLPDSVAIVSFDFCFPISPQSTSKTTLRLSTLVFLYQIYVFCIVDSSVKDLSYNGGELTSTNGCFLFVSSLTLWSSKMCYKLPNILFVILFQYTTTKNILINLLAEKFYPYLFPSN